MAPPFEWNEAKAKANEARHGVSFEFATRLFLDVGRIDRIDGRRDYGEERRITYGTIDGRLHVVVYTLRGEAIRLISARRANQQERNRYDPD